MDKSKSRTVALYESMWAAIDAQPEIVSAFIRLACSKELKNRGVEIENDEEKRLQLAAQELVEQLKLICPDNALGKLKEISKQIVFLEKAV